MIKTSYKTEIEYDDKDRIVRMKIDRGYGLPHNGHCVCNICGKDMPRVWDTVCIRCGGTHCYQHSIAYNGYWYCWGCIVFIAMEKI